MQIKILLIAAVGIATVTAGVPRGLTKAEVDAVQAREVKCPTSDVTDSSKCWAGIAENAARSMSTFTTAALTDHSTMQVSTQRQPCCIKCGRPEDHCDGCAGDHCCTHNDEPTDDPNLCPGHSLPAVEPQDEISTRDQSTVCCDDVSHTCSRCNSTLLANRNLSVWEQKRAMDANTYRYRMIEAGSSSQQTGHVNELCCSWVVWKPVCLPCPPAPSNTAATHPATTAKPADGRVSNDICCGGKDQQESECYSCCADANLDRKDVNVWKKMEDQGNGLYRFVRATRNAGLDMRSPQDEQLCCIVAGVSPSCMDCPVLKPPHKSTPTVSTATLTTREDSGLCCWTNGIQTFDCYLCTSVPPKPASDGRFLHYDRAEILSEGEIRYQQAKDTSSLEVNQMQDKCCAIGGIAPVCRDCPGSASDTPEIPVTTKVPATSFPPQSTVSFPPRATAAANEADAVNSAADRSRLRRQATYNFHLSCNGLFEHYQHQCSAGKATVNGGTCLASCHCDDLGSIHCDAPGGTQCTADELRKYCVQGSPYWACACSNQSTDAQTLHNIVPGTAPIARK